MGKNRQESTDTSTDTDAGSTDGVDFTTQQQRQPPTSGSAEAPDIGDDSISNPNIINR
jgi:hypothetical protein